MSTNKFAVDAGDLKVLSEEEFLKGANKIYTNEKPYAYCVRNKYCTHCDPMTKQVAEQLAKKIFESFFTNGFQETTFKKVLANFSSLCEKILIHGVVLTKEIYFCAKVTFVDLIATSFPSFELQEDLLDSVF